MAEENTNEARSRRRTLSGVVTSDKMDKTITVRVERRFKHPKYQKYIRRHTKYHAHDAENAAGVGDTVEIMEVRPMSKLKRWRLLSVTTKANAALAHGHDGGAQ